MLTPEFPCFFRYGEIIPISKLQTCDIQEHNNTFSSVSILSVKIPTYPSSPCATDPATLLPYKITFGSLADKPCRTLFTMDDDPNTAADTAAATATTGNTDTAGPVLNNSPFVDVNLSFILGGPLQQTDKNGSSALPQALKEHRLTHWYEFLVSPEPTDNTSFRLPFHKRVSLDFISFLASSCIDPIDGSSVASTTIPSTKSPEQLQFESWTSCKAHDNKKPSPRWVNVTMTAILCAMKQSARNFRPILILHIFQVPYRSCLQCDSILDQDGRQALFAYCAAWPLQLSDARTTKVQTFDITTATTELHHMVLLLVLGLHIRTWRKQGTTSTVNFAMQWFAKLEDIKEFYKNRKD
eukprot:jgi/Psemu1/37711/gm1.37711_g